MELETFDRFAQMVYEISGISLSEKKQALVTARVGKRMRTLGIQDHREYLKRLESPGGEQEVILFLDAISTNVTSFFREASHFDFVREMHAEWLASGQRRFRYWSAACSSGEEPYSLAMTLADLVTGYDVDSRILATDICTEVLVKAQDGIYPIDRAESIPEEYFSRFLKVRSINGATSFEVKKHLRDQVVFRRLNLSRPPFPMTGPLDAVFCRNVMIYFDDAVRRTLLAEIKRVLKPGGFLITGHAESLNTLSDGLTLVRPSIYRKN